MLFCVAFDEMTVIPGGGGADIMPLLERVSSTGTPSVGTVTRNTDGSVPWQVYRRGSVEHTPAPLVHLVSLKLASKDETASGN